MENIIEAKNNATWEIWADKAENRLHVHGEITVADKTLLYKLGRKEQGYMEDELMLEITPKLAPGNDKVSVKYHEDLGNAPKYKKVTIFSGAEEIATSPVNEQ